MAIRVRRIYEPPAAGDGYRVLVDRLWPRGLSKERARVDLWLREIAPSDALRKWYQHDPEKWSEFRRRYNAELDALPAAGELLEPLVARAARGTVTLLFSSRELELNNAVALRERLAGDGGGE